MMFLDQHYSWPGIEANLTEALIEIMPSPVLAPYILCIGTDRHILDCLGPLTGSLIKEKLPRIPLYGTLEQPLHAHNLPGEIRRIRELQAGGTELAIDASMGYEQEWGRIRLRLGGISPGKALGKRLPELGAYALTGVVKSKETGDFFGIKKEEHERLAFIYAMARIMSNAIIKWYTYTIPMQFHNHFDKSSEED